jgi:hypothetical protein
MKIRDIIQEFMPCEVCGNKEIQNFYFHVFVHQGSQPYVRCCECHEEYYSTRAREIITKVEDARKAKKNSIPIALSSGNHSGHHDFEKPDYFHPLLKALSGF